VLESVLVDAATVDLCILMDCTGSMSSYINAAKTEIGNLVSNINDFYPNIGLRLAFIAYRDHCDGAERLRILSFGESKSDVKTFQTFVGSQIAHGGGDAPEGMNIHICYQRYFLLLHLYGCINVSYSKKIKMSYLKMLIFSYTYLLSVNSNLYFTLYKKNYVCILKMLWEESKQLLI
jgi:hypothetical protein